MMKKKIKRLPDSELEVMMVLWETGCPMTSAEISDRLHNGKGWKITSVLTFLSRLAEKQFVSVERCGRTNLYRAVIREQDYLQQESKTILEKLYGNSLTAFVSSLFNGRAIEEKDLDDLRRYLDETVGGRKK
jgi:predicted transcriptional regulator